LKKHRQQTATPRVVLKKVLESLARGNKLKINYFRIPSKYLKLYSLSFPSYSKKILTIILTPS